MQPILILQLLVLRAVANGTLWLPSNFSEAPSLKRLMVELGSLTAVPLFGPSKSICGIVLAVLATAGVAALSALAGGLVH
jgi:hypothetical protein